MYTHINGINGQDKYKMTWVSMFVLLNLITGSVAHTEKGSHVVAGSGATFDYFLDNGTVSCTGMDDVASINDS